MGLCLVFDREILLFSLQGPEKRLSREKESILAALREYNAIVADLYATNGVPKMLNEIPATKAVRHSIFRDIGFIREHKRVLIYDMAGLIPVDMRMGSWNTAEAVMFEEWNYVYQQSEGRKPVSRLKGLGQGFRYRLVKENGRWLIYAWDPVEVEDPQVRERQTGMP